MNRARVLLLLIGLPFALCVVGAGLIAGAWFGAFGTIISGNWTALCFGVAFLFIGLYLFYVVIPRLKSALQDADGSSAGGAA